MIKNFLIIPLFSLLCFSQYGYSEEAKKKDYQLSQACCKAANDFEDKAISKNDLNLSCQSTLFEEGQSKANESRDKMELSMIKLECLRFGLMGK